MTNRNMALLWVGQLTSRLGTFAGYVALLMLVRKLTGSNTHTAIAGISQALPGIVAGLFAGAIIDRLGRKVTMIVTDIFRGGVTLIIPFLLVTGDLHVWHLFLVAALCSVGTAFFQPAEMAIIPEIVEKEQLDQANALARTTIHLGGLAGPPLGALLITLYGPWSAFFVDALSFFVSAVSLYFLYARFKAEESPSTSLLQEMREGMAIVRRDSPLQAILLCCIAVNFTYYPLPVLLPEISERGFLEKGGMLFHHLNPAYIFGGFMTALTLGKLIASLTIHLYSKIPHLRYFMHASNLLIALSIFGVGISPSLFLAWLCMVIIGYAGTITEVKIVSYVQTTYPEGILGRIFGIMVTVAFGAIPLSIAASGPLADSIGSPLVLILLGLTLVAASAIIRVGKLLEGCKELRVESTQVAFVNRG